MSLTIYQPQLTVPGDGSGMTEQQIASLSRAATATAPVFDVKQYGAAGDGTTDDTVAFEDARDAAVAAGGGTMQVPPGTYILYDFVPATGVAIVGHGRSSVLKLRAGSTAAHHIIRCVGATPVNDVYIADLLLDGNEPDHGLRDVQMHGVALFGNHENWTIERVHCRDCGGCGIATGYSGTDQTTYPRNLHLDRITVERCYRQDIALVCGRGITVSNCQGDGTFNMEANSNTQIHDRMTVTNLAFDDFSILMKGTAAAPNLSTITGLTANGRIMLYECANVVASNLVTQGEVRIDTSIETAVSNIVCSKLSLKSSNGTFSDGVTVTGIRVRSSAVDESGIELYNAKNSRVSDFDVVCSGSGSVGLKRANNDQTSDMTTISDGRAVGVVSGVQVNIAKEQGSSLRFRDVEASGGTYSWNVSSAGPNTYGEVRIRDCVALGAAPRFTYCERVVIDGFRVEGAFNLTIGASSGAYVDLDRIKFVPGASGVRKIVSTTLSTIKQYRVGKVDAVLPGTLGASALDLTGATWDTGVKLWVDGAVADATNWIAGVADANIQAGSLYRLRGNITNWGYTHNGTGWQARAH